MKGAFRYACAVLFIGLIWQIGSACLGEAVIPSPSDVAAEFFSSLGKAKFLAHAGASAWRVSSGMIWAFLIGYPLGLIMGCSRKADAAAAPLVFITYPVPKIVLLPVFFSIFGLGDAPRCMLIALTVGYQIVVVTRASVMGIDAGYIESFRSMSRSNAELFRHVLVPASLPDALTALRVASGTAVAVLFMAESFATRTGLGFLIMDAWGRGDQTEMFTGIIGMSLIGLLLYGISNLLERRLCPWRSAVTARGHAGA